MTLTILHY